MTFVPARPAAGQRRTRARDIVALAAWIGGAVTACIAWLVDHPAPDAASAAVVFVAYLVALGAALGQRPPQTKQ